MYLQVTLVSEWVCVFSFLLGLPDAHTQEEPIGQLPKQVTLSKPVQDRVSLIQQITSPKEVCELWSLIRFIQGYVCASYMFAEQVPVNDDLTPRTISPNQAGLFLLTHSHTVMFMGTYF